ncbi:ClpP/crotonase-like domain-containing protein [Blastocladiella britannica]|nr:ClpP/crotonase-like domain-containing protein [Blastocladiella britannica]
MSFRRTLLTSVALAASRRMAVSARTAAVSTAVPAVSTAVLTRTRWHSTTTTTVGTTPNVTDPARECFVTHLDGESDAGIAVVTLNRPAAKNALSRTLLAQISECLEHLRDSETTRVVVLRSAVDRVFCAGADLKERRTMTPAQVSSFVSALRSTFSGVAALPMPTIAALDGAALGGGLELAMCCDLRTAGTSAKLGLPETKLAIIPGAGGTQRLPRLIGVPLAKELMFTGRQLVAADALAMGLVNRADTGVMDGGFVAAMALAREIAPQGPVALRMAKWAVDAGSEVDLASGLRIEQACYAQVIPTADRLEGLKAFAEKRKPVYLGK